MKVKDYVAHLLSEGAPAGSENCPVWPPDVFCVAASLVQISGCYSHPRYTGGGISRPLFDDPYRDDVRDIASLWRSTEEVPADAAMLWKILATCEAIVTDSGPSFDWWWWDAAIKLLAIADEASQGIGFLTVAENPAQGGSNADKSSNLPGVYLKAYQEKIDRKESFLKYLPKSVCAAIPPSLACVQPKGVTPQVGCTLRSLSHHLALLPPCTEVETWWHLGMSAADPREAPLNLLLVPFPYRIDGTCFRADPAYVSGDPNRWRFFSVAQNWLNGPNPRQFADFLLEMIRCAHREVDQVHGVVLPEGALETRQAEEVAKLLASESTLELFVAGVASAPAQKGASHAVATNGVYGAVFPRSSREISHWYQSKHHRWKLDRGQIQRYHLGHALDPSVSWWENISVSDRRCVFYVFRHGASMTALVCEDLARIDPVQTALRALGPNLVVVLLMDGPQIERRWPGRYATVLADDPGSAVLTLTSLGMVRRSMMPEDTAPYPVALWKEAYGVARELLLPRGSPALLLTLSHSEQEERTLDGRSDGGKTVRLSLTGVRPIALSSDAKRQWYDYGLDEW